VARKLAPIPTVSANVFTDRAAEYLRLAQQSAGQALAAMEQLRKARKTEAGGGRSGTTSDQDQDLLRAMLVFSCAGLDAGMKALCPRVAALDAGHFSAAYIPPSWQSCLHGVDKGL